MHELLENQVRRNLKDNKDGQHDSASSVRKRQSSNRVHVGDGHSDGDGDAGFAVQQSTIVISKIASHNAFVEHVRRELVKANAFYATKLLKLKFELLQLLFTQIELGLVRSVQGKSMTNCASLGVILCVAFIVTVHLQYH